jgi:hypothetical protein
MLPLHRWGKIAKQAEIPKFSSCKGRARNQWRDALGKAADHRNLALVAPRQLALAALTSS